MSTEYKISFYKKPVTIDKYFWINTGFILTMLITPMFGNISNILYF